ncbi:MAG: hypothetical protein LBK95_00550, partial [Bifidobacteriaceae bacterium]|nr:hypothetical protein [Bifidobacteriaceae bacterium]
MLDQPDESQPLTRKQLRLARQPMPAVIQRVKDYAPLGSHGAHASPVSTPRRGHQSVATPPMLPAVHDAAAPVVPATSSSAPARQASVERWLARANFDRLTGLVERVRVCLRRYTERAAAVACTALLAGTAFIGTGGAAGHAVPADGTDALGPLADTIEVVSRRNMADLTSRTMTAQVAAAAEQPTTEPEIQAATQSNAGLVLTWDTAELD